MMMTAQRRTFLYAAFLGAYLFTAPFYRTPAVADAEPAEKTEAAKPAGDAAEKKEWGYLPFAIPFYLPETSVGIGWAFLVFHNPDLSDPSLKPDEYSLYGAVTIKNQQTVGVSADRYFDRNKYRLSTRLDFSRFPNVFWGLGPDTHGDDDEDFTDIMTNFQGSFAVRLAKNLYAGPAVNLLYDDMMKTEKGGLLDSGKIPGGDGTHASGMGAVVTWDSRDSVFYPYRGVYLDVKALAHLDEAGSEYDFRKLEADARAFLRIYGEMVLALQSVAKLSWGTVPFQSMPRLGGDQIMRGYFDGRFRDRDLVAAQAEIRYPIFWRFAGTAFMSAGQVAPSLHEMSAHNVKYAGGAGLRFIAEKSEHIALRFDAGVDGDGNVNFYVIIKEAF
ncbi:MAG: hypothetical protein EPN93_21150 [Spirochaetes bacterium]|nr:MAG: hypothetical protein EPN93_21150 [Spirochaetota bacterium]